MISPLNCYEPISKKKELEKNCIQFLKNLGNPTLAVTITFKRFDPQNAQTWNQQIIEKACNILIKKINKKLFKRQGSKGNKQIMCCVVIGTGPYKDHPHAHFALAAPPYILLGDFIKAILDSANSTSWIDREIVVKNYEDEGWLNYMYSHGWDNVIIDLCNPAKY